MNSHNNIQISTKSGITRLTLANFRNYNHLRLNTDISPIIITGENGSGKTNILEAISLLSPGRGIRGAKLSDIRKIGTTGAPWAVSANVLNNDEEHQLGTGVENIESSGYERRTIKINNDKASSQTDLGKYISCIWLTPQMDSLFRGGPQPRRSFLDRLVYAFDIEHGKRINSFDHLYKEWYQLIKSMKNDDIWLSSIERNMAGVGVAIAAARREQIARLNSFIKQEPDDIFPNVEIELDGKIEKMLDEFPAIDVEDRYAFLMKSQRKNILYNDTIDGINRTDFKVFHRNKNMPAELSSTGEQKSLLIGIILAQTKCQYLYKGFSPVLLLDEVVSHLDELKREALLEKIAALNLQAFITSTDIDLFSSMQNKAQFFEVANNKIK